MKKQLFSCITILLILSLTVSLLSACSGTKQENPETKKAETSQQTDNSAGKATEATTNKTDKEPIKYSALVPSYGTTPDMKNQLWTRFQKENNLELEVQWVPVNEFQNKLNLDVASGDLPDVVSPPNPTDVNTINAINNGVYWNLDPFLGDLSHYPNLKNAIPETTWKLTRINGKHYYIPRTLPTINFGYLIRGDLLKEAGLPVPKTVDELRAAMKTIKAKHPDMIGMLFDDSLAFAFGEATPQYNSDGGLIANYLTDSYTNMVDWYRGIYADGLMSPEFATIKGSAEDFIKSGKTMFAFQNIWHQYRIDQAVKKVNHNAQVTLIPILKGPGGNAPFLEAGINGGLLIPKKVHEERVKQLLDVLEQTASEDNSVALFYGYEGVDYKVVNGRKVKTDVGKKEALSFINDVFTIRRGEWDKVDDPVAPDEVNKANEEAAKQDYTALKIDPFQVLVSPKWSEVWPKYADEFETNRTKAIMGLISMDDYKKYINGLKNKPEFKEAFKELAASYKSLFN